MSEPAPRSPSRTALGVLAHRAHHQLYDGEPKLLADPIAERLLGADGRTRLDAGRQRGREGEVAALRTHVLLRSRYAEERLAEAAQRGVRQCVILGAGYDSFAYRQPAWARNLRIFEVDHGATQADKRQRLEAAGVAIPDNLEFVAIDFERTSLEAGLRASRLDFSTPTFFSCLGVFVYLTRPSIDAIFRLVASFPAGSEIAFTFSPSNRSGFSNVAAAAGAAGEPWLTRLSADEVNRDLTALGFQPVDFLEPAKAEAAYFGVPRTDGLRPTRAASVAAAIVGSR